jgi:hypothetical protein
METPQNGIYVAPEDSKNFIPNMDEALLGHTYDEDGTPILIYSIDLILDILENTYAHLDEAQVFQKLNEMESEYADSVVFCYT